MTEFSFNDLKDLARWLADPSLPDGALTLPALEGYLVALATHAQALPPEQWLPPIWGLPPGAPIPAPRTGDKARLVDLVIALHKEWVHAREPARRN